MKRRKQHPIEEAPLGSVWEFGRADNLYYAIAVVIGEKNIRSGNYPLLMLDGCWKITKSGDRFNSAVTTAQHWRRIA